MNVVESEVDRPVSAASHELRAHKRFEAELEVSMVSDSNFYMGFTENLSEGGLFVATHGLKPVGTVIELALSLPDGGAPIAVRGEVRWVREYSETSDAPPGMGIRFEQLDETATERIHDFLARRAPLFYED